MWYLRVKQLTLVFFVLFSLSASAADKFVIWIGSDKAVDGLRSVAEQFSRDSGLDVEVSSPVLADVKYPLFAVNGNGPDVFIWPHDKIGLWARQDTLAKLNFSPEFKHKLHPLALRAVLLDGGYYGYPLAIEVLTLAYNKTLLAAPLTSFEQILAVTNQSQKPGARMISWEYKNPYYSFSALAAFGAYAFKQYPHFFDSGNAGLRVSGAEHGLDLLRQLLQTNQLDPALGFGAVQSEFLRGEVAMMPVGPWSWNRLKQAEFPVGLGPLPSYRGKTLSPFAGVLTAMVNSKSHQQDIARLFIEQYLLTEAGLSQLNQDIPIGIPAFLPYLSKIEGRPEIQASLLMLDNAQLLPNINQMTQFWPAVSEMLTQLMLGADTEVILRKAQEQVLD